MDSNTLSCEMADVVHLSNHKEHGTVLRFRLNTNINAEHLGFFYPEEAESLAPLFGQSMPVTGAKLRGNNHTLNLKFVDAKSSLVITEMLANLTSSPVKESDKETPDLVPVGLTFITKMGENPDSLHALALMLKQRVSVEFSTTQEELFTEAKDE